MNAVRDERLKWATIARDCGRPVAVPGTADEEALPVTERACADEGVWLTQNVLLGSEADMAQIVEAVAKVQRLAPAAA
jgi:hypothetical protein